MFLPGESHGERSLVGFSPKVREESYMAEATEHTHTHTHTHTHIYIYPLFWASHPTPGPTQYPIHPSRPSQHWAELPVLYGRFPLAIYFTHGSVYIFGHNWVTELNWTELSAYISVLLSQFISPYPAPSPHVHSLYPRFSPLSFFGWWHITESCLHPLQAKILSIMYLERDRVMDL